MRKGIVVAALLAALLLATLYLFTVKTPWAGSSMSGAENNDNRGWRLTVDGVVDNPLELTYDDLLTLPSITETAKLQCVDDPSGRGAITSDWTGVQLKAILNKAGPSAKAIKVAFYAADGYSTDLRLETALRPDILIAYKQGEKLLSNSGDGTIALRLVVPGKWGYKWINWLTHIKVVDYNYLGNWETAGYSDEADIPPNQ